MRLLCTARAGAFFFQFNSILHMQELIHLFNRTTFPFAHALQSASVTLTFNAPGTTAEVHLQPPGRTAPDKHGTLSVRTAIRVTDTSSHRDLVTIDRAIPAAELGTLIGTLLTTFIPPIYEYNND